MLHALLLQRRQMQALVREAAFYRLPGLLQLISSASMAPSPGTREVWDSVYVETGFSSMQGEQLQQLERSKVRGRGMGRG